MATAIYKQDGDWLDYTPATTAVASGDVVLVGNIYGIASNAIAVGQMGNLRIKNASYDVPLKAGDNPVVSEVMFWDAANKWATVTPGGNKAIGYVTLVAPDGDATKVRIALDPALALVTAYAL